jgi:hypothetical protein
VDWNQGAPGRALRHQGKSAGMADWLKLLIYNEKDLLAQRLYGTSQGFSTPIG